MSRVSRIVLAAALTLLTAAVGRADPPIMPGYSDYESLRGQMAKLGDSPLAEMKSLGTTLGKREVLLLTVGIEPRDKKPAILVLGNVHAPHLVGSEMALRLARRLVEKGPKEASVRKLLERVTFYVIPRPTPDAGEAFFRKPYVERVGNERPVDDDHDGRFDEDGPEDINGDGLITMLRVADPTGGYRTYANDRRLLVRADAAKDEKAAYALYVEGRDRDADGQHAEDGPGGVAFNHNSPFKYPYFEPLAGPHAVSEVETRAVADFAFAHPNIALVLTFTPDDNLLRPWKADPAAESQRVKTTVLGPDAPIYAHLAERYRKLIDAKDFPESPPPRGSFSDWAYFQYGRWSLACRAWWIPKVELKGKDGKPIPDPAMAESAPPEASPPTPASTPSKTKKSQPRPGGELPQVNPVRQTAEDLNALRWFAREHIDGFVDWKPIAHPDFRGKKVEVGGFKPFLRTNPPAALLEPLADKHWTFLLELADLLPRLAIRETKVEPLGRNVHRVSVTVVNTGYLPTMSKMGQTTREAYPLQIKIDLPEGVKLATGSPRTELPVIAGNGGKAEHRWIVVTPDATPRELPIRVWSPSVGEAATRVKIAPPAKTKKPKS